VEGKLVWSKKTRGQGFFGKAEPSVQEQVYGAIRAASGIPVTIRAASGIPVTIQYCGG